MPKLPIVHIVVLLFFSFSLTAQDTVSGSFANLENISSDDWQNYISNSRFSISYKFASCESGPVSNQVLLLLKVVNLTDQEQTITWNEEIWRSGQCVNCNTAITAEKTYTLNLLPHQAMEGDCSSKDNKALYIFGNFINLTPGMSKQKLTGFRLVNVTNTLFITTN